MYTVPYTSCEVFYEDRRETINLMLFNLYKNESCNDFLSNAEMYPQFLMYEIRGFARKCKDYV